MWPPTIENLSPRQRAMLNLAGRTETYLEQERQRRREAEGDAGDVPGDVDIAESRREAFGDSNS